MAKIAPLIHARTYKCDFNTEFLVRPEDFMNKDIQWARNKILSATKDIDFLKNNVRWVICKEDKKFIAGVVGFLKDIAHLANIEDLTPYEQYFKDDKGRFIFAFIGYSIEVDGSENLSDRFDYKSLLDIFVDYVKDKWQRTVVETILTEYTDFTSTKEDIPEPSIEYEEVSKIKCYETNSKMDKKLFDYYLQKSFADNQLYFCSNMYNFSELTNFSIVTTSAQNIRRLKAKQEQVSKQPVSYTANKPTLTKHTVVDRGDKKKQYGIAFAAALVVVGIVWYFLRR